MDHEDRLNTGVVIVTYNNEATIAACVASLLDEGVRTIVVVDSNSSDATIANIPTHCTIVQLADNKGFSYAANIGASSLNTKYVLFLNPDTIVDRGAITVLQQTMTVHSHAGIMGGLLVDPNNTPEEDSWGVEPTLISVMRRHFAKKPALHNGASLVDWVSGGALMARADVFREVSGFDDGFFLYWEDVDLCHRVRSAGYEVYIDSDARIRHIRGGSGLSLPKKTALYDQSANRYFHKYYPPLICSVHHYLRMLYRLLRPLVR